MTTQQLIREVVELPEADRLQLTDALLRSLHRPDPAIDAAWSQEAVRRAEDLRSGRVQGVPGDLVLQRLRQRFAP